MSKDSFLNTSWLKKEIKTEMQTIYEETREPHLKTQGLSQRKTENVKYTYWGTRKIEKGHAQLSTGEVDKKQQRNPAF